MYNPVVYLTSKEADLLSIFDRKKYLPKYRVSPNCFIEKTRFGPCTAMLPIPEEDYLTAIGLLKKGSISFIVRKDGEIVAGVF